MWYSVHLILKTSFSIMKLLSLHFPWIILYTVSLVYQTLLFRSPDHIRFYSYVLSSPLVGNEQYFYTIIPKIGVMFSSTMLANLVYGLKTTLFSLNLMSFFLDISVHIKSILNVSILFLEIINIFFFKYKIVTLLFTTFILFILLTFLHWNNFSHYNTTHTIYCYFTQNHTSSWAYMLSLKINKTKHNIINNNFYFIKNNIYYTIIWHMILKEIIHYILFFHKQI